MVSGGVLVVVGGKGLSPRLGHRLSLFNSSMRDAAYFVLNFIQGDGYHAGQVQIDGIQHPDDYADEYCKAEADEYGQQDPPHCAPSAVAEELVVCQIEDR